MSFRLGAGVTLEQLERAPHPLLARLRAREPVSWIPALDGWLVTSYELALAVMRDAGTFTVDDPRFSTAQVIGPSMLSLDGAEHARHRAPFVAPFRAAAVGERFAETTALEAGSLINRMRSDSAAELRRTFAGPLAAAIVTQALGLSADEAGDVLGWYDAIVTAVTEITAGHGINAEGQRAYAALGARLGPVIDGEPGRSLLAGAAAFTELTREQILANAAVLLFGGVETTEGMIANAALALLQRPAELARIRAEPELLDSAIEESLRLEPAAAVIDRYATEDVALGSASIHRGQLVRISLTAANRDPAVFADPDRFDLDRRPQRGHLAFAQGPHVCVGIHLARLEARTALGLLLERLPRLRLDPYRPAVTRGLVFRKPPALWVLWDQT